MTLESQDQKEIWGKLEMAAINSSFQQAKPGIPVNPLWKEWGRTFL